MGRVGERSECREVETKLNVSSKIGEQIQGVQLVNLYHNSPGPQSPHSFCLSPLRAGLC